MIFFLAKEMCWNPRIKSACYSDHFYRKLKALYFYAFLLNSSKTRLLLFNKWGKCINDETDNPS